MILELLVEFLFPKKCVVCDLMECDLCSACRDDLELAEQVCPMCGERSPMGWTHTSCVRKWGMEGVVAVFDYRDERVKKIIEEIKFGFNRRLVDRLMEVIEPELGENFDVIVPVPLYFYRQNWRGFNQAEEIGGWLERKLGVPVERVLEKYKNTKQQAKLDREERLNNLGGVFRVLGEVKGKNILLVDDVFTSGATMRECARVLKKAGAKIVWGFVLGH